jgi:peptidylprolyl isomerase
VVKTVKQTLFSLRYQEIKIGTGAVAEPSKMYKVLYTGRFGVNGRADDWQKFDSTDDHPRPPVLDKDGKPVLGDDGKPKQGPLQPISFPQGLGRAIPGFDQGFAGMRIGGQRRIFIPWQLAYGAKGRPGPDAAHPGIPEKSDLIFDVELVDVSDMVMPAGHPGMMPGMRPMPGMSPHAPMPAAPAAPGAAPKPPAPATAPAPAAAPTPAAPTAPATAPAAPATPATPPQPQAK